jgi:hypothetical protein
MIEFPMHPIIVHIVAATNKPKQENFPKLPSAIKTAAIIIE